MELAALTQRSQAQDRAWAAQQSQAHTQAIFHAGIGCFLLMFTCFAFIELIL